MTVECTTQKPKKEQNKNWCVLSFNILEKFGTHKKHYYTINWTSSFDDVIAFVWHQNYYNYLLGNESFFKAIKIIGNVNMANTWIVFSTFENIFSKNTVLTPNILSAHALLKQFPENWFNWTLCKDLLNFSSDWTQPLDIRPSDIGTPGPSNIFYNIWNKTRKKSCWPLE